jgi:hypothetical protein
MAGSTTSQQTILQLRRELARTSRDDRRCRRVSDGELLNIRPTTYIFSGFQPTSHPETFDQPVVLLRHGLRTTSYGVVCTSLSVVTAKASVLLVGLRPSYLLVLGLKINDRVRCQLRLIR